MWKRFDRLSKAGVFEAFLDTLASMSSTAHLIQMFELHRGARSCVGGWSKGGQEGQALGRSRGGFTTKIHAKSDASGDIIAFDLTGGEAFDGRHFETLLDIGPDIQPRAVICDKGYASKANRDAARARGIAPVIPHKANEKDKPAFFARTLYKARARIEQGVGRLKRFKRVALRCEKDRTKLQINRQLRRRPLLDQIRPHGLVCAYGSLFASCADASSPASSRTPYWPVRIPDRTTRAGDPATMLPAGTSVVTKDPMTTID